MNTVSHEIKVLDLTDHKGRVFYTTDIHGYFHLLDEHLRENSFDSSKDILIIGGDMCDRGPFSDHVLDYLREPWVYCIRGNHEEMLIETVDCDFKGSEARLLYENGGDWFFTLRDQGEEERIREIYDTFKSLPLAIELILPNERIGIVHAEVPIKDWNIFRDEFEPHFQDRAQWSRTKYLYKLDDTVDNIDRVLVGHTPTNSGEIEVLGNVWYCDLGSFFRDKIAFIQLM